MKKRKNSKVRITCRICRKSFIAYRCFKRAFCSRYCFSIYWEHQILPNLPRNKPPHKWSLDEDKILYENYPKIGAKGVGQILSYKTLNAIRDRVAKIGLKYDNHPGRFKKGHISFNKGKKVLNSTCLNCGKKFYRIPKYIRMGYGNFCSKSCAASYNYRSGKLKLGHIKPFTETQKKKISDSEKGGLNNSVITLLLANIPYLKDSLKNIL